MAESEISRERSRLGADLIGELAPVEILHPPGTFALTPASRIGLGAIARNAHLLSGTGLDWGSGTGCLAIVAAKLPAVTRVVGLEIEPANVAMARENARHNAVHHKTLFLHADSYRPFSPGDAGELDTLRGAVDFILANPPSSEGDDGFEFRRIVMRGAGEFLKPGGVTFLNLSFQYGAARVEQIARECPEFHCEGVLASTGWVPFDLARPDLLDCLELYARCERAGGPEYSFPSGDSPGKWMNAQVALERFRVNGESPLTKWQTLLFRRKSR